VKLFVLGYFIIGIFVAGWFDTAEMQEDVPYKEFPSGYSLPLFRTMCALISIAFWGPAIVWIFFTEHAERHENPFRRDGEP
jgi:hypothetical protein